MTKKVANERLSICRSNKCGFYDKDGTSEAAFVKGVESCGACGCVLLAKVFSMESECGMREVYDKAGIKGKVPLYWEKAEVKK